MMRKTKQERIDQSNVVHDFKYDYSSWPDEVTLKTKVNIICPNHGEFSQILRYHCNDGCGCPKCRVEKALCTNLSNHGGIHASQTQENKDRTRQTNLSNHGGVHNSQTQKCKDKKRQTDLTNHNGVLSSQTQKTKDKITQTNLVKYGVKNPMLSNRFRTKAKQTNLVNHGGVYHTQTQEWKDITKQKNLKNHNGVHNTQTHILPTSLDKLNNKEWLVEQHHIKEITLAQIGVGLGVDGTTVGNYFKKHEIEVKSFRHSTGEREVARFILHTFPDLTVKCNIKRVLENPKFELDIYIPTLKIAIEYNGERWHNLPGVPERDSRKKQQCIDKGIRLITIQESAEWLVNKEKVKEMLVSIIKEQGHHY